MKKQKGLSLIELMISILIGSILLLGILQVYSTNRQTSNLLNGFAEVQENGRLAIELMSRDIRNADSWGCLPDASAIANNLDTASPNYNPLIHDFSMGGIQGTNNASSQTVSGKAVVDGTDILIVRGSAGSGARVEAPEMPTVSATVHINTGTNIQPDDVLLISDCQAGDIFRNTTGNTPTSGEVGHNTGAGALKNVDGSFEKSYGLDARVLVPYVKTFFIANGANGTPSLWVDKDGTPTELIPGVEDMQVLYGEDTNGDRLIDDWDSANNIVDMNTVLSVRVSLIVRSIDAVGTDETDKRLRKTYTVTTNIRNRML